MLALGQLSALPFYVLSSLDSDSAVLSSPPPPWHPYGAELDAHGEVDEVTSGYKHP